MVIWRLYPTLLYRSYKRVVGVLYSVGRLGIERVSSPCYALIWRLYAVLWRVYGVYMAVYGVGYAVMAYRLGLRDRRVARRWVWRVWSVVCTVCIRYGAPCRRGLSVGYGVYVG